MVWFVIMGAYIAKRLLPLASVNAPFVPICAGWPGGADGCSIRLVSAPLVSVSAIESMVSLLRNRILSGQRLTDVCDESGGG